MASSRWDKITPNLCQTVDCALLFRNIFACQTHPFSSLIRFSLIAKFFLGKPWDTERSHVKDRFSNWHWRSATRNCYSSHLLTVKHVDECCVLQFSSVSTASSLALMCLGFCCYFAMANLSKKITTIKRRKDYTKAETPLVQESHSLQQWVISLNHEPPCL